jgi:hypothetical protein
VQEEGKPSPMTLPRIQESESLGFEWKSSIGWEDRLSELADYCKIHGHCNVCRNYGESSKLAKWVSTQRSNYNLQQEGKRSQMILDRIQALEGLGFEWKPSGRGKGTRKKPSLDDDTRCAHRKPANLRKGGSSRLETAPSNLILRATGYY